MEQSDINLVNQIQICDEHLAITVCQIASEIFISEYGTNTTVLDDHGHHSKKYADQDQIELFWYLWFGMIENQHPSGKMAKIDQINAQEEKGDWRWWQQKASGLEMMRKKVHILSKYLNKGQWDSK